MAEITRSCLKIVQEKGTNRPSSAKQIVDILRIRYAYLSGGRYCGSPIIIFPASSQKFDFDSDDNQKTVTEEELEILIRYLMRSISEHDRENGFVFVLDRRKSSSVTIKTLLRTIETLFPTEIIKLYVLRSPKTYKKRLAEIGRQSTRPNFSINVVYVHSLEELHQEINIDQLSTELGGTLNYDHDFWILHRMKLEHLHRRGLNISSKLEKFAAQISIDCQNVIKHGRLFDQGDETTDAIENVLNKKRTEQDQLIKDLELSIEDIESFQDDYTCKNSDNVNIEDASVDFLATVSIVKNLLAQLDETKVAFIDLWQNKVSVLTQHFQRRQCETGSNLLVQSLTEYAKVLTSEVDIGDSSKRTNNLLKNLKKFESNAQVTCERVLCLGDEIRQLLKRPHYAADRLQACLNRLLTASQDFSVKLTERKQNLKAALALHQCIEEVLEWCNETVTLLAKQVDDFESEDSAEEWVQRLQDCTEKMNQFNINLLQDTEEKYPFITDKDIHSHALKALERYLQVKGMCGKRRNTIRQLVQNRGSIKNLVSPSSQPSFNLVRSNTDVGRRTVSIDGNNIIVEESEGTCPKSAPYSIANSALTSRSSSQTNIHLLSSADVYNEGDTDAYKRKSVLLSSRLSSALLVETLQESLQAIIENEVDTETDANVLKQRGQIINELIETEKSYINDLRSVITGYYDEMDNPAAKLPQAIRGKKNILFGNIRQLYNFHHRVFLKKLEEHRDIPALVGRCFTAKKNEFKMYTVYCKNRPSSEALWEEIGGIDHPFFLECQSKLKQQLPLNSYLIKPVQRITKYGLLLKDLLKHTKNSQCGSADLKDALDFLKILLKQSNDVMHQIAIKGFKGNLAVQGGLILQGSMQVCEVNKRGIRLSVRRHKSQRHVFLYEKMILFTKKQEECYDDGSKKYIYKYKSDLKPLKAIYERILLKSSFLFLQTCDIGMTESAKNQPLAFEIWMPGQPKVYIIQASTPEEKESWVNEIRQLLFNQLTTIKGIVAEQTEARLTHLHPGSYSNESYFDDKMWDRNDNDSDSPPVSSTPASEEIII
ncbi:uncharacterized protein TRIADDRAFT_51304 [Trichoplax adhaerens]|uniref:DH domain-containing protein n=1 Tax=Trichoplax adhaerens TaxID=10228 RepID=B3RIF9_TRIAD|nr:hypothetical protein TRIADDRAFT_51304 [Trichoplax adhaerens]EDV29227.1 hypothetical protein TRIADDRAFT_51304 [Trichoplax adhaerens]|eukprot:XP_002108429.1 hypothetical protein TRIADDRAFT_51304 [Trichoplax adhaerens]